MAVQKDLGFTTQDIDDVVRLVWDADAIRCALVTNGMLYSKFVETHTGILFLVLSVSSIHLVFDILAVRNDIAFFSGVENMTGQSLSAQAFQLVSQTVVPRAPLPPPQFSETHECVPGLDLVVSDE